MNQTSATIPAPSSGAAPDVHAARRLFALRLLGRLGVPAQDADDICQESLLRFYRKGYDRLDLDEGAEKALLARVGYSTWLDCLRRRRSHAIVDGVDFGTLAGEDHHQAIRHRLRDLVARAGLTAREIELLERRFGAGQPATRIAAKWGKHPNTIRRQLASVLDRVRHAARRDGDETEAGRQYA